MPCLRDAWRSTIDNLKFLTMKKYFLIITAICLSCAALMAEPVSKQKALQIASQVMDAKNGMKKAPALNTLKAEAVFGKVDAKGNPYLYAVCGKESGGYVLVSGSMMQVRWKSSPRRRQKCRQMGAFCHSLPTTAV